jgi:thiol:disulfide interchange protein
MGCCGGGCRRNNNCSDPVKYNQGDLIVVQFSAEWCSPCRSLIYAIKNDSDLQEAFDLKTIGYFVVDVDSKSKNEKDWINFAKPSSIPLVVLYKWDGKWIEEDKLIGNQSTKKILDMIGYHYG